MARMSAKRKEIYATVLRRLGVESKEIIKNLGEGVSFTLRHSVKYSVDPRNLTLTVYSPEHWAIYYHQGRSGVSGPVMVYFRDPAWDPRITKGGYYNYPVSVGSTKKLTKAQYRDGMRQNRRWEEDNPDGGPMQWMVVTRHVGPTTGVPYMKMAKPAIRKAGKRLMKEAGVKDIRQEISAMIKKDFHERSAVIVSL